MQIATKFDEFRNNSKHGTYNTQFLISAEEFGMLAVNCPECDRKILITRIRAHLALNHN